MTDGGRKFIREELAGNSVASYDIDGNFGTEIHRFISLEVFAGSCQLVLTRAEDSKWNVRK